MGSRWIQRASIRTAITSHLQEGLVAYAAEMADMEHRCMVSWERTWASIHGRAKMVLERLLKDKDGDGGILIPTLTVEIDMEDSNDLELYDKLSDTE